MRQERQSRMQQTTFINIFSLFSEKIRLDVSNESSVRQRIHMKSQALFASKDKSKKLKCRLLQFLFGALRVDTSSLPTPLGAGCVGQQMLGNFQCRGVLLVWII